MDVFYYIENGIEPDLLLDKESPIPSITVTDEEVSFQVSLKKLAKLKL